MEMTKAALDKYGIKPDIIIGCAGGGSNLGGLISPFMGEKLRGEADYRIIAVEIDFYTAVHEELAGEGIALPVVFAAVCVHLAKGVACVGIETGKHEAGA